MKKLISLMLILALALTIVPMAAAEGLDPLTTEEITLHLEERFLSHPPLAIEQSRAAIIGMAVQTQEALSIASGLLSS